MLQEKKIQQKDRDSKHVALAAIASAILCQLSCHPFGVISIRQQRAVRETGLGIESKFDAYSIKKTINYIYKKEGLKTFYNGLRYSLFQTIIGTSSMLVTYEKGKVFFGDLLGKDKGLSTLAASLFSTFISTTLSFPLEYWKTISQSYEGSCTVRNFQLGKKVHSAYFLTLTRQMTFFSVYWPTTEFIRLNIKNICHQMGLSEQKSIFFQNIIAGSLAGVLSALVTQPIDIIKTRKQVFDELNGINFFKSLQIVYNQYGVSGFLAGVKPRVSGVVAYGSIMLFTYETIFSKISLITISNDPENLIPMEVQY